jgi:hypothetical protein
MYFPWVLMLFNLLMGGFPLLELVGVVAGHAYYFMQYVYPETYGRTLITCPEFVYVAHAVTIDEGDAFLLMALDNCEFLSEALTVSST